MVITVIQQKIIRVGVEFYSDTERAKLLAYPTKERIIELVSKNIEIPIPEFLTYYLFHTKRPGRPEYRDYNTISRNTGRALSMLDGFITFNGASINWEAEAQQLPIYIPEYVGESIGLAVMNRMHGLTEADWAKIDESRGPNAPKVFDYNHMAANDDFLIEVETKGSCINDDRIRTEAIRQHKSSILEKKNQILKRERKTGANTFSCIRYGTITAIPSRSEMPVKCLLVDPPDVDTPFSPRSFRLLNRMRFLRDWICFVSPRSNFAQALATRVLDLETIANPFELDNAVLQKANGEPFAFSVFETFFGHHSSFFANKSRVVGGPAGGVTLQISKDSLFFFGIREDILDLATEQRFENILRYKAEVASISKTVVCTFSSDAFKALTLPPWILNSAKHSHGYSSFQLEGQLHYSQEGLVFGVLPFLQE